MYMSLEYILGKSLEGRELEEEEVLFLLEQKEKVTLDRIFETARKLRERYFGTKVFLYSFVYFSTYCKNNCSFCYFRNSNDMPPRYRKSVDEIVSTAMKMKAAGIHLIDLTMGEDPYFIDHPERLTEIVRRVKEETKLPIMISPGVLADEVIDELIRAGADWYALYQETHNRVLFGKLRAGQDYQARLHAKEYAKKQGMLVEEGLLTGVGNQLAEYVKSFEYMKRLGASQVRTMTFIPQKGSPMGECEQGSFLSELLNIAVMRLIFPKLLIPASLDVDGLRGLEERLNAGANVITSIIPPKEGYAGVANAVYDIDEGHRTIEGIQESIHKCGLRSATAEEYENWLQSRQNETRRLPA
jgi:methylornithine synthase